MSHLRVFQLEAERGKNLESLTEEAESFILEVVIRMPGKQRPQGSSKQGHKEGVIKPDMDQCHLPGGKLETSPKQGIH